MVVGIGIIRLRLHNCHSLKDKRKIVRAMIKRIQNQFNVSIAETANNDVHQRAEIGFALVGNSGQVINAKMDKLLNLADELNLAEIFDSEMEIMHL